MKKSESMKNKKEKDQKIEKLLKKYWKDENNKYYQKLKGG